MKFMLDLPIPIQLICDSTKPVHRAIILFP